MAVNITLAYLYSDDNVKIRAREAAVNYYLEKTYGLTVNTTSMSSGVFTDCFVVEKEVLCNTRRKMLIVKATTEPSFVWTPTAGPNEDQCIYGPNCDRTLEIEGIENDKTWAKAAIAVRGQISGSTTCAANEALLASDITGGNGVTLSNVNIIPETGSTSVYVGVCLDTWSPRESG